MVFSKSTSYAVRALIYLSQHKDEGSILTDTIAHETRIPAPFLGKILGTLAAAGYVSSTRGRNGGYVLKANLDDVTLSYLSAIFDPSNPKGECLLGHGVCGEHPECSVHQLWSDVKSQIDQFLTSTTLADLMRMEDVEKHDQSSTTASQFS